MNIPAADCLMGIFGYRRVMGNDTGISWTDCTWNPVTGCTPASEGCANCYAERMHKRGIFGKMPFSKVTLHPDRLEIPLHWRKPRKIFVCSMSDLFHDDIPDDFIDKVFAVMALCLQHTFQVLTKRPVRMLEYMSNPTRGYLITDAASKYFHKDFDPVKMERSFPFPNAWLGVTVENQARADERIPLLLQTPAAVRFVSCEPMLSPINLTDLPVPGNDRGFCFDIPLVSCAPRDGTRMLHGCYRFLCSDRCSRDQYPGNAIFATCVFSGRSMFYRLNRGTFQQSRI